MRWEGGREDRRSLGGSRAEAETPALYMAGLGEHLKYPHLSR